MGLFVAMETCVMLFRLMLLQGMYYWSTQCVFRDTKVVRRT